MKHSRAAIGALMLASVVALATPLTAQAARGGGGGGHFGGGGGGHFGGGGGHFGGGGGGFHFGGGGFHPGGGGMHFGGGGMRLGVGGMHFGGGRMRLGGGGMRLRGLSHLGGMHLDGGRIGGFRIGGGRTRLGGLSSGRLSHGPGRGLRTGLAGRELQSRSFANLHSLSRGRGMVATRVAPGFSRRTFARAAFGRDRFGRFDHDRFGYFRRFGVFGWAGPVFWPYAYNDIYCDIFWGYWGYGCADPYWSLAYGNPFWGYGYSDIYGGLFSPFGFDDLAAYLPSGGRRGRSTVAAASTQIAAQMCGDDTREVADWPIDRIRQLVLPDDQQSMALDDLANASLKAAQIIKDACPASVAFTPTGRLADMQRRIEAMQQAVNVVRGPLDRFYAALTDEQKAKLDSANQAHEQPDARSGGLAQSCNRNVATQWPEARIEMQVRPNEEQQAKLKALQSAATQAAERLATSCPSALPTTPPARLAEVSKRLDVMLQAVKNVRVALDDFYGDLNDEQKAQFNKIGQSQTAER
jgi:LTXXQ motif family protein